MQVISLGGSTVGALHDMLRSFYCPILLQQTEASGASLPPKMQAMLSDLSRSLGHTVRDGGGENGDAGGGAESLEQFGGIQTPEDEFAFWSNCFGKGVDGDLVRAVNDAFSAISEGYGGGLERHDWSELDELVEATHDALHAAWSARGARRDAVYPQARMAHVFDVIGGALSRCVQKKLGARALWTDAFAELRAELASAAELCARWARTCEELSEGYWRGLDGHPWDGPPHVDGFTRKLGERLDEIVRLRTAHEELARLLDRTSPDRQSVGELFQPFAGLNPLLYNEYTQPAWRAAVAEHESRLAPIESQIAANFRRQTAGLHESPLVLLREFGRFRHLLGRPKIRQALAHEREALVSQLVEHVDGLEQSFDASVRDGAQLELTCNLSPHVNRIVCCRQITVRAHELLNNCRALFADLKNFADLEQAASGLLSRGRREEKELLQQWSDEVEGALDDRPDSLRMRGQLMHINKEGLLTVNYSERLVRLLREVRQLSELGLHLKPEITAVAAEGEKFYRYGVMLKKVANFFNKIEKQIIPQQRPMLLDALVEFEKIVTKPTNGGSGELTWSTPTECEHYVERLQQAAEKLTRENRLLVKVHRQLGEQLVSLMMVDMLRQREQWKAQWQEVGQLVTGIKARYAADRMAKWLLHWDRQMYKVVEAAYIFGLESLNENLQLPDSTKVELAFSQGALAFRPSIEELRSVYYREMKKFISIPNGFKGFGNANVYRAMASANTRSLVRVYEKAEVLFGKLAELAAEYKPWVVLGSVDVDALIEQTVSTCEQYEVNFKMLRAKRKDSEKIPDAVRVDCFNVSLGALKTAVDDQLQQLGDSLLVQLRRGVLDAFRDVDAFLTASMEKLSARPHSVDEIAAAQKAWKEIDEARAEKKALSDQCLEKKTMLLAHAPMSSIDTSEVTAKLANVNGEGGRWDTLEIAMEAFNEMIEEQKEQLKTVLEERVMELNQEIEKFAQRWSALKPKEMASWARDAVLKVFADLAGWKESLEKLTTSTTELAESCGNFGMANPSFLGLEQLQDDIGKTLESWDMLQAYMDEIQAVSETDWISFRNNMGALQDIAGNWMEKVKATYAAGKHDLVTKRLKEELEKLKSALPCLKFCNGSDFKEEHWVELLQGKLLLPKSVRLENLKVGDFLSALEKLAEPSLLQFVKQLQARAQGEVLIREALDEMQAWTVTAELKLLEHEEAGRSTSLIKDWKDLFLELGDKQSLLSSLKESQFYRAFEDRGRVYEEKLATLDVCLHTLNSIQRKWVYLEPIFERGALPQEQRRFKGVDDEFREIMGKIQMDPKLFQLADEHVHHNLKDTLLSMLDQLERCQKALAEFLEEKRDAFSRFYFIGDDDLLEILGQAKNPAVIQSHLKKLFQGINKVQFNDSKTQIVAMVSSLGEVVPLEPVTTTDKVEEWLTLLADEMKASLTAQLSKCYSLRVKNSADFDYESFPSQVLDKADRIRFATDAEAALRGGGARALADMLASLRELLEVYTSFDLTRHPVMQSKVKALILDLVHHMDVVQYLEKARCADVDDWAWHKQLRYYMADDGTCKLMMCEAIFDYTYEYQGNAPKLVHTPLTDKCYLTLTQGMHMGFGGNPYGPAGTGKTESVKALGNAFGRQVLVFNCDEGIDFQSMGRIFCGLVKCGAWGCFDEFNRLKEDQLSAISQQIQVIQDGIKQRAATIHLLGQTIAVDTNAGIFVTLNPAGKDYGGRSNLPDNLKALFRPVAMGRPDNELIAEVILYSEGFTGAKDLAGKIVSLFTLSKQLLSAQQHYDWGLRALKAVLNTGGKLVQIEKRDGDKANFTPKLERELLIKAVRVNTLSKLTFADTNRFLALIGDVFPDTDSTDIAGGDVEAAIREVMVSKEFGFSIDETQIRKMLQLKEALDQRMGCVVVGPSGCGKTAVWRVLREALQKCGQKVVIHVMNPKSMPRQQLLGDMDLDTREWQDGVLTQAARQVVKEPPETRSWIVCDGDVDPEWIESLNSVLDDNHLLTLPNGERISFGPNVNFLFETHDLSFASPATISRMGMIFLSNEDIDVRRVLDKWLTTQPEEHRGLLEGLLKDYFHRALEFVLRRDMVVETTLVGTVMNGLTAIHGVTTQGAFVCGLIRGLGGNLGLADRTELAKELFGWSGDRCPDPANPLDCWFDESSKAFKSFANASGPPAERDENDPFSAVVSTISVQRNEMMLQPLADQCQPFILVGPEGCGKAMMMRHVFAQRRKTLMTTIHCNAQTDAQTVIQKIASTCSLFSAPEGRVYRPRDCERLILYLKDINLPKPDMYQTCMLIAFLQQLVTFGGFYDENLEFLRMEQIQIVASMNPATTVGRHPISTRFTAIVRVIALDYPDTPELTTVYASYLEILGGLRAEDSRLQRPSDRTKLAATLVEAFEQIKGKFSVDDHRHYLFTPRDITAWVRSLLRYDLRAEELLDVLAYEAARLFRDRMVDADSEKKFDGILNSLLRARWKHSPQPAGSEYYTTHLVNNAADKTDPAAIAANRARGGRQLGRISVDDFKALAQRQLVLYEREERDLQIKLFPEILDHLAFIDRVLSQAGGHLLLTGRSGVGRRTATVLASYMLGHQFMSPSVTRGFDAKGFAAELKPVLQVAGVDGQDVVLYLEDHQFTSEAILELVNSLISAGEVPGLYTHEELEPLLAPLKEAMLDDGACRTPYEFFVSRVQRHLHVAIAMDPTNAKFALRCESNPALYTRCAIVWMGEWRAQSMRALPSMYEGLEPLLNPSVAAAMADEAEAADESKLGDESKGGEGKTGEGKTGEGKAGDADDGFPHERDMDAAAAAAAASPLCANLVSIHEFCQRAPLSASPRQFVVFLENWRLLHEGKEGKVRAELKNLTAGLSKLEEAAATVDFLSKNAAVEQKKLQEAQIAADASMEQITSTLASASDRRTEVADLKADVSEKEKATLERKEQIEEELSSITPILEQAKSAVGQIKSEHLNEIRSLKMPPEPIADVLGAVLKLLGIHDVSWLSMKKFLGNRGVKDEILTFDAHRISGEMRKEVAKLLKNKASSFDAATITRVSVAAAPLAAWVKANIKYSVVLEKIQPLEAELEEAESALERCTERLKTCEDEIAGIDKKVALLKDEFSARTREAEVLRAGLEKAQLTLEKAEGLLGKLSGEQTRWVETKKTLRDQLKALPQQMLLAAAFMTYLAKTPEDARESATREWIDIVDDARACAGFDFTRLLSTESQLLSWKQSGLPADPLSRENAIAIVHSTSRVPFIIDPANAAGSWLKAHLSETPSRPFESIQSHDARFVNQVELAVRFGKTLLIFDVDGLEPMLYPLARKDLQNAGPRKIVALGDKQLDFNENFRMLLVTRNPSPDLPPDAAALICEVNFTVTRSGLEGQLLGITIQHEQPELESKKSEMLKQEEDFKIELAALEKKLLEALATSEGDILENTSLIESLTQTKVTSKEIADALEKSSVASLELDQQREVYRPFARDGSTLFFLVSALIAVNSMYQFSLASFVRLFNATLGDAATQAAELAERLGHLTPALEKRVLYFVGRGLFKADRHMFAMHLVHGMHASHFRAKEWEYFTGELPKALDGGRGAQLPNWASADRAGAFAQLHEHFGPLVQMLDLANSNKWSRWAQSLECERDFPSVRELTPFQRVMVTQTLRPDRLLSMMQLFACEALGVGTLSPPPVSMAQLYDEAEPAVPTLLITTAGADPSKELEEFATEKVGREMYKDLAMGGGQQEIAQNMLKAAADAGEWLCLKNLHLVVAWLPTLEKLIASTTAPKPQFRLWLTTEPHQAFPRALLQQCLKATFESPPGLKKNLQRTLSSWGAAYVEKGSRARANLLFVLAWFHAVVQERRTYLPQGWTKFYEFSVGDLRAGSFVMDAAGSDAKGSRLDFNKLHGLMEDAIYGGRVDNLNDGRVLLCYLRKLLTTDVIHKDGALTKGVQLPRGGDVDFKACVDRPVARRLPVSAILAS